MYHLLRFWICHKHFLIVVLYFKGVAGWFCWMVYTESGGQNPWKESLLVEKLIKVEQSWDDRLTLRRSFLQSRFHHWEICLNILLWCFLPLFSEVRQKKDVVIYETVKTEKRKKTKRAWNRENEEEKDSLKQRRGSWSNQEAAQTDKQTNGEIDDIYYPPLLQH